MKKFLMLALCAFAFSDTAAFAQTQDEGGEDSTWTTPWGSSNPDDDANDPFKRDKPEFFKDEVTPSDDRTRLAKPSAGPEPLSPFDTPRSGSIGEGIKWQLQSR